MGKCSVCGEKILYNKYKMYRGKVLCPDCYSTRLERKAAKKAELQQLAEMNKIVTPTKKAKKKAKKLGLTVMDDVAKDEKKSSETAEDSR